MLAPEALVHRREVGDVGVGLDAGPRPRRAQGPSDRAQPRDEPESLGLGKRHQHGAAPAEASGSSASEPGAEADGDRVVVAVRHVPLRCGGSCTAAAQGARQPSIDQIVLFAASPFRKAMAGPCASPNCVPSTPSRAPAASPARQAAAHQPAHGHHPGALPRGDLRVRALLPARPQGDAHAARRAALRDGADDLRARGRDGAPAARTRAS